MMMQCAFKWFLVLCNPQLSCIHDNDDKSDYIEEYDDNNYDDEVCDDNYIDNDVVCAVEIQDKLGDNIKNDK